MNTAELIDPVVMRLALVTFQFENSHRLTNEEIHVIIRKLLSGWILVVNTAHPSFIRLLPPCNYLTRVLPKQKAT